MHAKLVMSALLVLAGASAPARADTYVLDKQHTEVRFSWNHLGLSRQSGRFLDVEGRLEFDPEQPESSQLDVRLKLASLSTGVKELDAAVKSREFLDAAQYPVATFHSTSVKRLGEKTAQVMGELTLAAQTHPVTLEVNWNFIGEHPLSKINPVYTDLYYTGFSATSVLRRSDWGITRTIPYVSDEIQLTIEAELRRTALSGLTSPPAPPPGKNGTDPASQAPPIVPPPPVMPPATPEKAQTDDVAPVAPKPGY